MAFRSSSDIDNAIRQACQRYIESEAPLHRRQVISWLTSGDLLRGEDIRAYVEADGFMTEPQFENIVANAAFNPAEDSEDSGDENFGIVPSLSRMRSKTCARIDILAARTA